MRYFHELLGDEERRSPGVEETRNVSAAHERDRFELLNRRVHGVEAVGVQLEGTNRLDAGDEEDEAPGQVALAALVFVAAFRVAEAAVLLAQRSLAPAENADRAFARAIHRHRRVALAVTDPAVRRVLAPEFFF